MVEPGAHLFRGVEAGREPVTGEQPRRTRQQAVQHEYPGFGQPFAQGDAFLGMGDEKDGAAFGGKAPGDRGGAEAVAVGLDDGGAVPSRPGAAHPVPQQAPVGGERIQVDGQHARGFAGLHGGYRFSAPRHDRIAPDR